VASTWAAISQLKPAWLLVWRGAKDPAGIFRSALRCGRTRATCWDLSVASDPGGSGVARDRVDVLMRRHKSGGPHEIRWIGRDQIHVWSSTCREKTPWVPGRP
jgi:hypothetical protein